MLSGLDLDEYEGIQVPADNINFAGFLPIVSELYAISLVLEIGHRNVFTPLTEAYSIPGQTL